MNYGYVRFILGRILLVEAALLCPSLLVGIYYRESWQTLGAFIYTIFILLVLGLAASLRPPASKLFYAREGFVIVSMTWLLLSVFGSFPLFMSGSIPSVVDAIFETASGFTTTGASILRNIEILPRSILFWRSFTHLVGGMGVLVFVLAIMPKVESEAVHIMKAEVPGPSFGKLLARVGSTARVLYIIYLIMTGLLVVLLTLGDMPLFDSFLHAFGAAGTGGFSSKNLSIGHYNSTYIHMVLAIAMIMFGINFNLYYLLLARQIKTVLKNEEFHWYAGIILAAFAAICLIVYPQYESVGFLLRDVFFTVSSIITTTGYATVNFDQWPLTAHVIILLLMFCGAMSGSTGGGLKVSRIALYIKTCAMEIRRTISPNRRVLVKFEHKPVDMAVQRGISFYIMTYLLVFFGALVIISLQGGSFVLAFSAVAATLNNIGPGLDAIGPVGNYADMSILSKLTLTFVMIAGRLEIFPVLILFSARTWRRT
jgi:trk system potassium uptake protein